jgi:hypothetical protein
MNLLLIFTLLFTWFGCSVTGSKSDFEKFDNNFKQISFPLIINDSVAFESWNMENLIDTNYIKQFELIANCVNKDYPLKGLQDYKCSYFGKYESENYTLLLYKTYTTEAGRGNPEIILATFTKDGKKKDEITALWNDAEDPLYNQRVTLNIPNNNKIEIKSRVKNNGYLNGEIAPKKITEKVLSYTIQKDGKILLEKESTKVIFKDENPEILDDFPQE